MTIKDTGNLVLSVTEERAVTSDSHELVTGEFATTELADFGKALTKLRPTTVQTPAFDYVRKLLYRGQSAIVSIPDGGGKTTFLESMERSGEFFEWGDEENWFFFSNCSDANSLALAIWEFEVWPVPTQQEVWEKGRIGHMMVRHPHQGLTCFYCSRECRLIQLPPSPFFTSFTNDDVMIAFQKIGAKLGGDCPVIKNWVFKSLLNSENKENVIVEVPKSPSQEYLKLLRLLQKNRQMILLCPPEAEETLHNAFSGLAIKKAPPMPVNLLLEMYSVKLNDAGLTTSPLSVSSLRVLALLCQGNAGRFFQTVSQLIDDMEIEDCRETVSDAYVSSHIRDKISDPIAIKIIIEELRQHNIDWVKAKTLHNMLLEHFGLDLGLERIGNLMKENFITKRRNPDAEYHIGAEASMYLTEGTEGTEG